MGMVVVKIKIMPTSPEVNLKEIGTKAREFIENSNGKGCNIKEEPIAFGLKALIIFFGWDEEKELDTLENSLRAIENVNSAEIIDLRRAIG